MHKVALHCTLNPSFWFYYFKHQEINFLILSTKVEGQRVKPKGGTGVWHECGHLCITLATEPPTPLHLSPGLWNHSSVRASFRNIERKAEISFSGRLVAVPLE